jgi:hypothetical protein
MKQNNKALNQVIQVGRNFNIIFLVSGLYPFLCLLFREISICGRYTGKGNRILLHP